MFKEKNIPKTKYAGDDINSAPYKCLNKLVEVYPKIIVNNKKTALPRLKYKSVMIVPNAKR